MFGRAIGSFNQRAPQTLDQRPRSLQPMIQILRTDNRFHDVTQHIVALLGTIIARLFTQPDMRR